MKLLGYLCDAIENGLVEYSYYPVKKMLQLRDVKNRSRVQTGAGPFQDVGVD